MPHTTSLLFRRSGGSSKDADYKSEIRLCSRQIAYSALRVKQHLGIHCIPTTDRIFHCAESMVRYNMDT